VFYLFLFSLQARRRFAAAVCELLQLPAAVAVNAGCSAVTWAAHTTDAERQRYVKTARDSALVVR
jgi:hypothetical protein